MALPNSELFKSFLSQTKLVKVKPEGPSVLLDIGEQFVLDAAVLYLSYPEMELKLNSVLKRIASELNAMRCSADPDIALATLGIIVETRAPEISSVAHANHCLSIIHSAQLHQFVVLPNRPQPDYALDPRRRVGPEQPIDLAVEDCINSAI
jgi:hypothetical protein